MMAKKEWYWDSREHESEIFQCILMTFDVIQMGVETIAIEGTDWMTRKAERWGYIGKVYTLDECPSSRRKERFITDGVRNSSVDYELKLTRRLGVEGEFVHNTG